MNSFLEKNIKFLGKSENTTSIELLSYLFDSEDKEILSAVFDALYLKKDPAVYLTLFLQFVKNESVWKTLKAVTPERLARLAETALKSDKKPVYDRAVELVLQYRLYETLPILIQRAEGEDDSAAAEAGQIVLKLANSFYDDLVHAPDMERRNLERRRDWFAQQLNGPIKKYAVRPCDAILEALLIISKKDYDTMRLVVGEHRSAVCQKAIEMLTTGTHGSFIRLLLSYVNDSSTPAVIDEVLCLRQDSQYVRRFLDVIGPNPNMDLKDRLKRFTDFSWLKPENPALTELVVGLERNAVQLIAASGYSKDRMLNLYDFFLTNPSADARRATVEALRRLVGEEVNSLLLECLKDKDSQVAAQSFRILKSRGVKEIDQHFVQLVEREEEDIRKAIYETMPELRVESFTSRIGQMTPQTAKTLGRLVKLVDPNTLKTITDDISSPIPIRRLAACKAAMATGFAHEFEFKLIELADEDDDTNVRIAAVTALGTVLSKNAVDVIKSLMNDRSMDVREAATLSIRDWMTAYQARQQSEQSS